MKKSFMYAVIATSRNPMFNNSEYDADRMPAGLFHEDFYYFMDLNRESEYFQLRGGSSKTLRALRAEFESSEFKEIEEFMQLICEVYAHLILFMRRDDSWAECCNHELGQPLLACSDDEMRQAIVAYIFRPEVTRAVVGSIMELLAIKSPTVGEAYVWLMTSGVASSEGERMFGFIANGRNEPAKPKRRKARPSSGDGH